MSYADALSSVQDMVGLRLAPEKRRAVRHVLVVDDEPGICDVVKMALESDGA